MKPVKERQEFLTTKEAAEFLNVSPSTLYKMEKLELISSFRTPGGQRRFAVDALRGYIEKSKNFKFNHHPFKLKSHG